MSKALQPVVKVWLHSGPPARLPRWGRRSGPPARLPRWGPRSTGDASPSHPNAAAALGAPAPAALLLAQILPVLPPHRANHARRGPRFAVVRLRSRDTLAAANFGETSPKPWGRRVAPCRRGASLVPVRRQTSTTD